jgi:hypothetical protein
MQHEDINFIEEMDKDDDWLKSHLEEIVDRYAHRVVAILDQEIVEVGESIHDVQQKVATHHPARVPLIFEVPSREEFTCLLSSTNTQS